MRFNPSPNFFRRLHFWAMIFWVAMIPISFWTGLIKLIVFCNFLSLWALVATEGGAWQGGRVEAQMSQPQSDPPATQPPD